MGEVFGEEPSMAKKRGVYGVLFLLAMVFCPASAYSQSAAPPSIFFTDLQSGPNTGGQNNNGVFVTIFGTGFGATQGSSTVTIFVDPSLISSRVA